MNKINSRTDFTHKLSDSPSRYVVTYKKIWSGKNPSINTGISYKLVDIIESGLYDSIGGWKNKKTGDYFVGANLHFESMKLALRTAQLLEQGAIHDLEVNKTYYLNKNE
jgi:hypothetical protein